MSEYQQEPERDLHVRVSPELRAAVIRAAQQQHRTVSDQLRYWLTQATGQQEEAAI